MRVLRIRGNRANLLLFNSGKKQRTPTQQRFQGQGPGPIISRWQIFQGLQPARVGDMLPLPSSWTLKAGLSSEARILELWDTSVPIISGMYTDAVCSSLPPPWTRRGGISRRALHKVLPLHIQARWTRAGVEVKAKAHKTGLQGPRGVSTSLHRRLSLQISVLFRVCFYSFAYGQECYLIMVHLILLLLHLV